MTASLVKGNEKNARSVRMSWFDGVCLTAHVLQREQEELCVPSVLLCVVEAFFWAVTRTPMTSRALSKV